MVGNAGSDERILIQEIFEPKLLSTFETLYAVRVYFFIVPHGHMVTFAMLSTCLDLELARRPQFRGQLLQPSCAWKAVSILCTVLSEAINIFWHKRL